MFGAIKGGGVLDRQGLHEDASSSSLLSSALVATASNEFSLDGRGAGVNELTSLAVEASSGGCVNGAGAAAAAVAISAAN